MTDAQRAAWRQLIERNARACEEARRPQCVCRCRGAMHGKQHGAVWIQAQVQMIELATLIADMNAPPPPQQELFT